MKPIELMPWSIDLTKARDVIEEIPVDWDTQLCVTSRHGNDLFDGIGSINDYDANEHEFSVINEFFRNTVFDEFLTKITNAGYILGRVRLMRMNPRTAYSYHMDCQERVHVAIETNYDCMLIVDDNIYRIPDDGNAYKINTTLHHTAINCSNHRRIHLVVDLLYKVSRKDENYIVMGNALTQHEFDQWLVEIKPKTDKIRSDYFIDD